MHELRVILGVQPATAGIRISGIRIVSRGDIFMVIDSVVMRFGLARTYTANPDGVRVP